MNVRLHAVVRGRVQGVGFRYFVADEARNLGLVGTVCNRPEGTVEILAEGPRPHLETLLDLCRQGPALSVVRGLDTTWEPATGEWDSFQIVYG